MPLQELLKPCKGFFLCAFDRLRLKNLMLAQSFGDNRRSRLALDSGFSRCARLVAGRPNAAQRRAGLPVAGRIAHWEGPRRQGLAEMLGAVPDV